jgi:hypothetical protein
MRAHKPQAAHHVIAARKDLLNLDAQVLERAEHRV